MKKFAILLVVILVVVVVTVPLWIDSAAKAAVETAGSDALKVPVTVAGVNLGIFGGTCDLDGFEIANPEGYDKKNFFSLGKGEVEVNLGSVMEDKVVIPKVVLEDVEMNFQRTTDGTNYGKILDALDDGSKSDESTEGKRFVIESVVIKNVRVTSKILVAPTVPLTIPEIRLDNLGSDSPTGIVMADVIRQIFLGIFQEVGSVGKSVIPELSGALNEGLKGVVGVGEGAAKTAGDIGKKAINEVEKGLGGLLGGNKKKEEDK